MPRRIILRRQRDRYIVSRELLLSDTIHGTDPMSVQFVLGPRGIYMHLRRWLCLQQQPMRVVPGQHILHFRHSIRMPRWFGFASGLPQRGVVRLPARVVFGVWGRVCTMPSGVILPRGVRDVQHGNHPVHSGLLLLGRSVGTDAMCLRHLVPSRLVVGSPLPRRVLLP